MTLNILAVLAIVLLAIFGLATASQVTTAALGSATGPSDNTNTGNSPSISQHIVPTNQSTWPSGDKIWDCCRAIALAEGYNVPNSNPANLNNPGDISDGQSVYGSEFHSGSNITHFPDANTGWSWLYNKLANILNGTSKVYNNQMSWNEIGAIWAPPNATVWADNVSNALGVDPDSSISDYVNS